MPNDPQYPPPVAPEDDPGESGVDDPEAHHVDGGLLELHEVLEWEAAVNATEPPPLTGDVEASS